MRDFLATIISLGILLATVWGIVILAAVIVDKASIFVPSGLLYFSAGVLFASCYKRAGEGFMSYCNVVWERVHDLVVWR